MRSAEETKEKHLRRLIAGSFFLSVIAGIIGWLFPPDFSVEPPKISEVGLMMGHMQTALIILGCTALGIKLTEEKKTIASIGFTMMAITQGVIFVLYVVSPEPTTENLDEIYKLFAASLFLLIPSMLLISFYSEFPKWLNLLGIAAIIPWIIENIMYFSTHKLSNAVGTADLIGQLLMNATVICWAIYTLKKSRNEKQSFDEQVTENENNLQ